MASLPDTLEGWLARLEKQHPQAIDLGLARVRDVAARMALGKPARQVISVAGTNGKGSTVAFIESITRAAGMRVGSYTSPHLLRYNERVRIDGKEASDADLINAFNAVEAARGDISLTYFEAGTLAVLWLFERARLDLAVLEVGLGGRLDAVNTVDADAAVITTVDLDHQDWLGDDIEQIGFEKAGIARAWKPLVLGDDDPPASVLRHAYAIGASSWRIANDFFAEVIDDAHWRWREVGFELVLPMPTLAAPVQLRNAACAIAALRSIGFEAGPEVYARGIEQAHVGARLQRIDHGGIDILIDVGHNPQAARALAEALRAMQGRGRTRAVYAALGDKDVTSVVETLRDVIDDWYLAGSESAGPRGLKAEALAARMPADLSVGGRYDTVDAAIDGALGDARAGDRLLVFGGFHAAEQGLKRFAPDRPRAGGTL
ncbi:MAG: bifunctional tetrahydrofolate synthase/dihydrofolate synthase [Xanthomonadaceae bacterium]|nr:bifunctional tetrahydrofolate synthase/dihydrofolate synthase [Xanthomonadaceae bacterium]